MTEPAKLIAAFVLGALFAIVLMREVNAPRLDTTRAKTWERHYRDPREGKRPA